MKNGIALCGGGSLGSYEYGAIKALLEQGITFDVVTGTSIGSLNGTLLAANRMDRMKEVWENVTVHDVIKDGLDLSKPLSKSFSLNPNSPFQKFVKSYLKDDFGADVSPLKELIERNLEGIEVSKLNCLLGIVACTYPGLVEEHYLVNDLPQEKVKDYLLASCSCFPAFPICDIDGKSYVDGGWKNNLPIDYCLELGADRVYAVLLESFPPAQKKEYFRLPNVTLIAPSKRQGNFLNFEKAHLERNAKMGYLDALIALKKRLGEDYCFHPNKSLSELSRRHLRESLSLFGAEFTAKSIERMAKSSSRLSPYSEEGYFLLNLERAAHIFGLSEYKDYGVEEMAQEILRISSIDDRKEGKRKAERAYWHALFWGEARESPSSPERKLDKVLFNTIFVH